MDYYLALSLSMNWDLSVSSFFI